MLLPFEREIWEALGEEAKGAEGGSSGLMSASMWRVEAACEMVDCAWDTIEARLELLGSGQ